ncbi:hypothetical protein HMI56_006615 [Coelomomyces lativittatus]|nr:hypothetical protein HMI56_006615 [Coelomomyces lativittatus]
MSSPPFLNRNYIFFRLTQASTKRRTNFFSVAIQLNITKKSVSSSLNLLIYINLILLLIISGNNAMNTNVTPRSRRSWFKFWSPSGNSVGSEQNLLELQEPMESIQQSSPVVNPRRYSLRGRRRRRFKSESRKREEEPFSKKETMVEETELNNLPLDGSATNAIDETETNSLIKSSDVPQEPRMSFVQRLKKFFHIKEPKVKLSEEDIKYIKERYLDTSKKLVKQKKKKSNAANTDNHVQNNLQ